MKTKTTVAILTMLLSVSLLELTSTSNLAAAIPVTIQVQPGNSIQEAINSANPGDTVLVAEGTYTECIVINKTLTLEGSGQNRTIIQAPYVPFNLKIVIDVQANNVNISGFKVQNGLYGILLSGYNGSIIKNNNVTSKLESGIYLNASHHNVIANNTFSLNNFEGIRMDNSTQNWISNNLITKNKYVGVEMVRSSGNIFINNTVSFHSDETTHDQAFWMDSSDSNTFEGNLISNNARGFEMSFSQYNTIRNNTLSGSEHAVYLIESNNTSIYHNNFFYNTYQVDSFDSFNTFDNGYPSGGNFWSDYAGVDVYSGPNQDQPGSDGIGDTAYIIDVNNRDRYPLVPPGNVHDTTPPNTTNDYNGLWHNADFSINLPAVDDISGIKATYYEIGADPTIYNVSAHGQPFVIIESANNTLTYWSVDGVGNEEPHNNLINIKLDKTSPAGSMRINNGAAYATSLNVTLSLFATDSLSGIAQMQFSNDGTSFSQSEAYSESKTWNLGLGDGAKTVYVSYLDNAGNSQTYNATIVLDTAPPLVYILSPGDNGKIRSQTVTIDWSGTDLGLGIDHYEIKLDQDLPINVGDQKTYTFSGLSDGNHTVIVEAFDKLGRTAEASVSFIVDTSLFGGLGYFEFVVLVVILVVAVGLVISILIVRRKRRLTHVPNALVQN